MDAVPFVAGIGVADDAVKRAFVPDISLSHKVTYEITEA